MLKNTIVFDESYGSRIYSIVFLPSLFYFFDYVIDGIVSALDDKKRNVCFDLPAWWILLYIFLISFLYFYLRRSLQSVLSCKAGQEIREMEKCVFLFLSCVICYRFDVVVVFWMNKRQKSLGETTGNSQNKGKRKLLDARVPAVLWPPPVSLSLSLSLYLSISCLCY